MKIDTLTGAVGVAGVIAAALLVASIEKHYPDPAPLIESDVHKERTSAMSIPCLYVCQKYLNNEPCGRRDNTRCTTSADLTRKQ